MDNCVQYSEYLANSHPILYNNKKGIGVISMDKYYSYTDFLRAVGQYPQATESEKLLNDIYLDLFLGRLQRLQRIDQLKKLIDMSLDQRNEQAFYKYANEICELQKEMNE